MDNSLKQRIIGAVVLAGLAVIFLPAILKEKSSNGVFVSKIPDKPQALEEYTINTQKIDQLMAEKSKAPSNKVTQTQASPSTESLNTERNKVDKSVTPNSESSNNDEQKRKTKTVANTSIRPELTTKSNRQTVADNELTNQVNTNSVEAKASVEKKTVGEKFINAAWVVQVASFSKQANAVGMVNKLKKNKFKAYRRKVVTDKQTVYRVFVGPYIERKDAEKSILAINKISEGKTIIKPFDPIKH